MPKNQMYQTYMAIYSSNNEENYDTYIDEDCNYHDNDSNNNNNDNNDNSSGSDNDDNNNNEEHFLDED